MVSVTVRLLITQSFFMDNHIFFPNKMGVLICITIALMIVSKISYRK